MDSQFSIYGWQLKFSNTIEAEENATRTCLKLVSNLFHFWNNMEPIFKLSLKSLQLFKSRKKQKVTCPKYSSPFSLM